jgi:hypothetical protein
MLISSLPRAAAVLVLLFTVAGAALTPAAQEDSPYGIYSNMNAVDGEYSGFEFIVLPSNEGDFVVFQQAEGVPMRPQLISARIGGTRAADNNVIQFDHPELGPFRGAIQGDSLVGEFAQTKQQVTLAKGNSVWQ